MKTLTLAADLFLPPDVVKQRLAFLGRTGSGKTYAAMKLVELMLDASMQVVVLDTVGVWPGLRTGPKPFSIPVFGGSHGDMQLLPTHGALLGNWLATKRSSAILDISHMIADEVARFGADFAEAFFLAAKRQPSPVHIVLEECQDLVPESARTKLADRCCKNWERIQKQGRNFEIGVSLISQRPQDVAKTVLNQTECLFAFQMTGTTERKAISKWVSQDIDKRLPSLQVGHCFVWSQQWLQVERWIHILPKQTPELSQLKSTRGKARALSEIDLNKLRGQLDTVAEETKLIDPVQLRDALNAANQKIAALEQRIKMHEAEKQRLLNEHAEPKEFAALKAADRKLFERLYDQISGDVGVIDELYDNFNGLNDTFRDRVATMKDRTDALQQLVSSLQDVLRGPTHEPPKPAVAPGARSAQRLEVPSNWTNTRKGNKTVVIDSLSHVDGGQRDPAIGSAGKARMLIALAQNPAGLTDRQIAIRADLKLSGTFSMYMGALNTAGFVEYQTMGGSGGPKLRKITAAGLTALGPYEPLPVGRALRDYWLQSFGNSGKAAMLRAYCDVYPRGLTNAEVAARTGLALSGTFSMYLGALRTLGLVEGDKASAELFDQ